MQSILFRCLECGRLFRKSARAAAGEVVCPRCSSIDVEVED
jgi:DNA-directed RNA polymerase subunit RPC12/RpoP